MVSVCGATQVEGIVVAIAKLRNHQRGLKRGDYR